MNMLLSNASLAAEVTSLSLSPSLSPPPSLSLSVLSSLSLPLLCLFVSLPLLCLFVSLPLLCLSLISLSPSLSLSHKAY